MKAIILAAGEGKRLRPLTDNIPKCMVPFHGRPLIDYQLATLRECGIEDIVVVKGYKEEMLNRERVRFIINKKFETSNMVYSLFCAENEMNDDLIISYGDIIYNKTILMAIIRDPAVFSITIDNQWLRLWQLRMANPLKDAETLKLDRLGNVIELGKKPKSYGEIQGQYMGLIKINHTIINKIKTFYHSLDQKTKYDGKDFNNMFMTSFLQELINSGFTLKGVPIYGGWLEIDTISDLNLPLNGA